MGSVILILSLWGVFMALPAVHAQVVLPTTVSETCRQMSTTWQPHPDETPRTLNWSYCIYRSQGSRNQDVLYYFHPARHEAGRHEQHWRNYSWLYETWQRHHYDAPTVVTVSFGPLWLLVNRNTSTQSGLWEFMRDHGFPFLERQVPRGGRRIVMGESMGGFNVSQLILRHHRPLHKAVMICPALASVSPFGSFEDMSAYMQRTQAEPMRVFQATTFVRMFLPQSENWLAADPLGLAQTQLGARSPDLYITCGRQDQFGFFEGAERFANFARLNHVPHVVWQPLDGGHCVIDRASLAQFLME